MTAVVSLRDARLLNWQFVVPPDASELLLLADPADAPREAITVAVGGLADHLRSSGWPAIVAPDLGRWRIDGGAAGVAGLLATLAGQVKPGGWLAFGISNAWYPGSLRSVDALGLSRISRILHGAGLRIDELYLALPDHRHPAVLAAADPRTALNLVLDRRPTTYVPEGGRWPRLHRKMRRVLGAVAGIAPHWFRIRLVPGFVIVARRPT
jgi:hypothetical protein